MTDYVDACGSCNADCSGVGAGAFVAMACFVLNLKCAMTVMMTCGSCNVTVRVPEKAQAVVMASSVPN